MDRLNPLGLDLGAWVLGLVLQTILRTMLDLCLQRLAWSRPPLRPTAPLSHWLGPRDHLYLFINTLLEYVVVSWLARWAWHLPRVDPTPPTVLAPIPVMVLVDDLLYWCAHRLLHWGPLYRAVHKHHHAEPFPRRGYADAGNEHPVEQLVGFACLGATCVGVGAAAPVHWLAVLIFFILYAAGAILNHTNHDVRLGPYQSRAHEMHHRYPKCNFSQNVTVWDRLFGTYTEWHD